LLGELLRVAVVGFASPLHSEASWKPTWRTCLQELRSAGLEVAAEALITGPEASLKLPSGLQAVVAAVLTGGTSKQVARLLWDVGRPTLLAAFTRHNSLPSALEARAYLRERSWVKVLQAGPGWGLKAADLLKEATKARGRLAGRVLAIGGASIDARLEPAGPEVLARRLGIEVEEVGLDEVREAMEKVDSLEVEEELKSLARFMKLKEPVEAPVRLYLASKRLMEERRATGVTFNCFSLLPAVKCTPCIAVSKLIDEGVLAVCEAEAPTLGAAAIVHRLLGLPFFVANVAKAQGGIVLAHCTAPASLCSGSVEALPHFESGMPAALDVELKLGQVTLVALSKRLEELMVSLGRVKASSLKEEGLCRTQAFVEVGDPMDLLSSSPGGHLVLAYGDLKLSLRKAAEALSLDFREVGEKVLR
jgi:L-fucose isomerase-like protein